MPGVNETTLREMLPKVYKYRDLTVHEIINVITQFKDLTPAMDNYVFNDGSTRELMSLTGTIPVPYKGNVYNIPICVWLLDTYPYNPPICFVKPTNTMMIKTGKHVDANGKIYFPYLHEWKQPQSDLLGLIQVMVMVFGEDPPVYSRRATQTLQSSQAMSAPLSPSTEKAKNTEDGIGKTQTELSSPSNRGKSVQYLSEDKGKALQRTDSEKLLTQLVAIQESITSIDTRLCQIETQTYLTLSSINRNLEKIADAMNQCSCPCSSTSKS